MPSKKQYLLITILILSALLLIFQFLRKTTKYEGFTQSQPYTIERGNQVYDAFYSQIYDKLYRTNERADYEAKQITAATYADKESDNFLDIGCGTGAFIRSLRNLGYKATGIDKSQAMVDAAPDTNGITHGDAQDPMMYDRGVFSHITCLNQTLHEIEDRTVFFRNCHYWLKPGGYFIVHIVDKSTFDPIIPLGRPSILRGIELQNVKDTVIDFTDFQYKSSYKEESPDILVQRETFTDTATHKIRENERILYVPPSSDSIIDEIEKSGFSLIGQFTYPLQKGHNIYICRGK